MNKRTFQPGDLMRTISGGSSIWWKRPRNPRVKAKLKYQGALYISSQQQGGPDTMPVAHHPDYTAGGDPRQRRICRLRHEMIWYTHTESDTLTCCICNAWIWIRQASAWCNRCSEAYCYYCSSKGPRTFTHCHLANVNTWQCEAEDNSATAGLDVIFQD